MTVLSSCPAPRPTVPVELAHPVMGTIAHYQAGDHQTLAEIIAAVPDLPDSFHRHGMVTVEQGDRVSVVPRHYWARGAVTCQLRLKADSARPVTIRLHAAPSGGRGKGLKSVLAIVASIALMAVGGFIVGGGLAGVLGGFAAANTFGAHAIALAVTFLGRLALTMAAKPAASSDGSENQAPPLGQAGATGNLVSPGGTFLYCAGRSKVYPQLACLPLVGLEGDDEVVEAAYVLAGPHQIDNLAIEDTPLGEIDGLSWVVNQGTESAPQSILSRYGHQITPQFELKAHRRSKTIPAQLEHPGFPETDLPKPYMVTTKNDPDEVWLQYLWPGGMTDQNGTPEVAMPLRLSLQATDGSARINLPELMFHSNLLGRISKYVKLVWGDPPSQITDAPFTNGAWHSFHTVPGQPQEPVGLGAWSAHQSFVGGTDYNATLRVERRADGFVIYLSPSAFPRGNRWKVWQMRGCLININNWGGSGIFKPEKYAAFLSAYAGDVWTVYSPFGYRKISDVCYTANSTSFYSATTVETCLLMRCATVWNRKPVPLPGDATIEVRGRNVNVTQLSCEASALIPTWDGTGFSGLAASNNPADHFYHAAAGGLTTEPVPARYINLPELAAWHADNVARSRTIAAVFDGREWRETLDAMAAAGLAARKEGRLLGVARQRNTAVEVAVERQVFSHLNARNIRWTRAGGTVPDAVRVTFRNRDLNWDQDELLVIRPGLTLAEVSNIVAMDAVAIDTVSQVRAYFELYLSAAWHRDWTLSFETWFEGLAAEKGDIISLNHIELAELMLAGRISEVERNGANEVTAITLDAASDGNDETLPAAVPLAAAIPDMARQGLRLAACLVTAAGPVTHPLAGQAATDKRLTFEVPFVNDAVVPGQMALLGREGETRARFEVVDISPSENFEHTITVVPEAPEIWT